MRTITAGPVRMFPPGIWGPTAADRGYWTQNALNELMFDRHYAQEHDVLINARGWPFHVGRARRFGPRT